MLQRCKVTPCVIFKQEPSHVLDLDSSLRPLPFNCSTRSSLYPGLKGAALELLDLRNSWCLYPGGCTTFEDILAFVRRSDMQGYQWVVLGLPFLIESRLSNAVVSSAPLTTGQVVIVSYARHRPLALHEALHAVSAPFHRDVWVLLFSVLLTIVVLFVASHVRRGSIFASLFRPFMEWAFENPSTGTTENEDSRRRWFFSALRISYFMLISIG